MSTTTASSVADEKDKKKRARSEKSILERCLTNMIEYTEGKDADGFREWKLVSDPRKRLQELYRAKLGRCKNNGSKFGKLLKEFGDRRVEKALVERYGECLVVEDNEDKAGYEVVSFILNDKELSEERKEKRKEMYDTAQLGAHFLAATDDDVEWNRALKDQKLQANHRCHNTRCIKKNHVYLGTKMQNQANNSCCAWVLVQDKLISACGCPVQCILPGPDCNRVDIEVNLDSSE
jgi:hypothetical protein